MISESLNLILGSPLLRASLGQTLLQPSVIIYLAESLPYTIAVDDWVDIDGTSSVIITHTRQKQFVPVTVLRTDNGEIQPGVRALCSAVNTITLELPTAEILGLTVLVGN